ncbi:MAG TPA: hypothetical protein DHV86_03495, partial [Methylophilaceae bacterium]|nr:hypothetical protein [Methylophilaceae bacterium]
VILNYYNPYINELVEIVFMGFFVAISSVFNFLFHLMLRSTSILIFGIASIVLRILSVNMLTGITIIVLATLTNTYLIVELNMLLNFIALNFILQLGAALAAKWLMSSVFKKPKKRTLIFTDTKEQTILDQLNIFKGGDKDSLITIHHSLDVNEILNLASKEGCNAIYLHLEAESLNSLESLIESLSRYAFELHWILPKAFFNNRAASLTTVCLNLPPVFLDINQYIIKRAMDVIISSVLLLLLSPLFILVAILIKLTDGGPVIYSQLRHGYHAEPFLMFKFRSMALDSDLSMSRVTSNDDRVTRIGKFMRTISADELPQLWNVLAGEMSLVGPRPHILSDTDYFSENIQGFLKRHQVKPGLTGLAQINSRGKTDSIGDMELKLRDDMTYIEEWALLSDLHILIKTPIAMWNQRRST